MERRAPSPGAALVVGTVLLLVVGAAPLRGQATTGDDRSKLDGFDRRVVLAQQKNDLTPLASLFSEEAVLMAPDLEQVQGRAAIARAVGDLFREFRVRPVSNEVGGAMRSPNTGAAWGTRRLRLTPRDGRPPRTVEVRYLFVYRLDPRAGWRLLYAMAD